MGLGVVVSESALGCDDGFGWLRGRRRSAGALHPEKRSPDLDGFGGFGLSRTGATTGLGGCEAAGVAQVRYTPKSGAQV